MAPTLTLHYKSEGNLGETSVGSFAIVTTENPAVVSVISSRNTDQRAVLKFAAATTATAVACHLSPPGTVTNQIQAAFPELRLLVITDPRTDHQPLTEASCLTAYHCSVSHRLSSALCGHCHLWQ